MTTTTLPLPRASERPTPPRAVGHVLAFSGLAVCAIVAGVMVGLHGWSYYTAPMAERGYNQAWELARRVAQRFKLPAQPSALMRTVTTVPQARLSRQARLSQLQGVFSLAPDARAGHCLQQIVGL